MRAPRANKVLTYINTKLSSLLTITIENVYQPTQKAYKKKSCCRYFQPAAARVAAR